MPLDFLKRLLVKTHAAMAAEPSFERIVQEIRTIHPALCESFYQHVTTVSDLPQRFDHTLERMQNAAQFLKYFHAIPVSEVSGAHGYEQYENTVVAALARQRSYREEYEQVRKKFISELAGMFEEAGKVAASASHMRPIAYESELISSMEEARQLLHGCMRQHGAPIPERQL